MEMDPQYTTIDTVYAIGRTNMITLPVGGYLVAVSAEVDLHAGWPGYVDRENNIRAEITNWDEVALYGDFEIAHVYGFHKGGVLFPEPLPNVNSACPYVVKLSDNAPPLRIHAVHCGVSR
jgi:hypothetical protein